MQSWNKVLAGALVLLSVTVVLASADDLKERWEYGEQRGYSAPSITAEEARNTVQASRPSWRVAAVHQKWEDEGLEIAVLIHNQAGRIAKLRVDPQSGEILPRSVKAFGKDVQVSNEAITKNVEAMLPKITVGDQAWLGEHGRYWRIPLFLDGMLVSSVKVDARSGELLSSSHRRGEDDDD
jgi:hypothetical protein